MVVCKAVCTARMIMYAMISVLSHCAPMGRIQCVRMVKIYQGYRMDALTEQTSWVMRGFGRPRRMLTIVTTRGSSISTTATTTGTIRTITILFV